MVCPILISVSLTPGPYCFWASAGCADNAASVKPSSPTFLTNIGFLQVFCCDKVFCCDRVFCCDNVFCCGGSVSERRCLGKPMRGITSNAGPRPADDAIDQRAGHVSSHSSEI